MNWDDMFDARPSKNSRGEDVLDIYRKGTEEMIWSDIRPDNLDDVKKSMEGFVIKAAQEEFDALFETPAAEEDYESIGFGRIGDEDT